MQCPCIIEELIETHFDQKQLSDKLRIIKQGRPCPHLPHLNKGYKNKSRSFTRHFAFSNYKKVPWLTGCSQLNKLFCWPCLLFSPRRNLVWSSNGYDNLNNLAKSISKHEKTIVHISAYLKLKNFTHAHRKYLDDSNSTKVQQQQNIEENNEVSVTSDTIKEEEADRFIIVNESSGEEDEIEATGHHYEVTESSCDDEDHERVSNQYSISETSCRDEDQETAAGHYDISKSSCELCIDNVIIKPSDDDLTETVTTTTLKVASDDKSGQNQRKRKRTDISDEEGTMISEQVSTVQQFSSSAIRDEFTIFGEYVTVKLRQFQKNTQARVLKAITDIICDAQLGKFD